MWYESVINRGAEPVRWVLVAAIAYTLATTIWTFFETPVTSPVQEPQSQDQTPARAPANVNWILSKHLFGEAGATPVQDINDDEPAVQTRLPLELQSVFVADEAPASAAIVAERGKPGKLYSIDDKLPGNATLVEVLTDRIILRRAGTRETLMFPKVKNQFVADPQEPEGTAGIEPQSVTNTRTRRAAAANNRPPPVSRVERIEPAAVIDEYAEKLATDAAGTLDELGIESVDATANGGYRIGDLASSPYFRQSGLESGDVILSVNGRPVGDIQQDRMELANIIAQGSARIEIQRGSRRFFITAPLSALNQ